MPHPSWVLFTEKAFEFDGIVVIGSGFISMRHFAGKCGQTLNPEGVKVVCPGATIVAGVFQRLKKFVY